MPRQIEVWDRDMWVKWGGPTLPGQQWRYVGGVLEYRNPSHDWMPVGDAWLSYSVEEMSQMATNGNEYRLRPYETRPRHPPSQCPPQ